MIETHAYARAGLIGNPSDGYFGKTISFIVRNFRATVQLTESDRFEIHPGPGDLAEFASVNDFLRDIKLHGYYGAMRLVKAAIKRFFDYARTASHTLHSRNFTITFSTDIPRLVGLSGSSAIVIATFRALMRFYNVEIPKHILPTLALSTEKDELNINCGLQDRVIQTYEGIVYMDFDRAHVEQHGFGLYEALHLSKLPPLYIAYDPARAEISDVPHRNLRELFDKGDPAVHAAMKQFRDLVDKAKVALLAADWPTLGRLMDANFDLRRTILNIAPENLAMIQAARATGASAKFAGSGGAIVGLYRDEAHYAKLCEALGAIKCSVIKPVIVA